MTDFEIEKTLITGMVKTLFKGVRVVSDCAVSNDDSFRIMIPKKGVENCVIRYVVDRVRKYADSVEMAFDNGMNVESGDEGNYFTIDVVTCKLR